MKNITKLRSSILISILVFLQTLLSVKIPKNVLMVLRRDVSLRGSFNVSKQFVLDYDNGFGLSTSDYKLTILSSIKGLATFIV